MSEETVIAQTDVPLTTTALTTALRRCGLADGQTVLVHLAMSKLGWVIGGAEAVILALLAAVGDSGTIMMPAHSGNNTDPNEWQHPPVPESWWQPIRDHTPAYNPLTTPTRGIGVIPELFRSWPGAVRSSHPAVSFAAVGKHAELLVADHLLNKSVATARPWARSTHSTAMFCSWASSIGTTHRCTLPSSALRIPVNAICATPVQCWLMVNANGSPTNPWKPAARTSVTLVLPSTRLTLFRCITSTPPQFASSGNG